MWREGETRCSGRRTHHPTRGNKKGYNGRQGETRPSGRRTHHPTKGIKKGYTIGDKGRQDPREGGHTIQQRESRRGIPSHASSRALWWQWKHLFEVKWNHESHINFLEMNMILLTLLWKCRDCSKVNKRWLHLEDSMMSLYILT